VATASHDASARVYDALSGACLQVLAGHEGRLNRVVPSPDGTMLATCSDDGSARLWDASTGACTATLGGHPGWVNDARFSGDGDVLVTVGGGGGALVWDLPPGRAGAGAAQRTPLEGHGGEVLCVAVTEGGGFAVTGGEDGAAKIFDLSAPSLKLPGAHSGRVKALAIARDGAGGATVASVSDDNALRLMSAASGRFGRAPPVAHASAIHWLSCVVAGDDDAGGGGGGAPAALLTASADRCVCRWDGAGGAPPRVLLKPQQGSRVKAFSLDAGGARAAVLLFDSTVAVWDLASGELAAQLIRRGERSGAHSHTGGVNAVHLTSDGATVWTASKDATARAWSVASGECTGVLAGHGDSVNSVALSADEALIATCSFDKTVRVWRAADGAPLASLDLAAPAAEATFSPRGDALLVRLEEGPALLWLLPPAAGGGPGGGVTAELDGGKPAALCGAFSADGALVALGWGDCTLRVWRCDDGQPCAFFMADAAVTACAFLPLPADAPPGAAPAVAAGDASGIVHILDMP
jgi:WD40 repeat protein